MAFRAYFTILAAILLLMAAPVSLAGHTDNKDVTFNHKTGNEWWVEVVVGGDDAGTVSGVDARDTNGDWAKLEKKSWGAWAGSFHIEPGHLVQFRAQVDGGTEMSCWFTHPEGEAQCSDAWQLTRLRSGATGYGLTMKDADEDGRTELLETDRFGVPIYEHREEGWVEEDDLGPRTAVAIDAGDANNDGSPEVAYTFKPGPRDRVGTSGIGVQERHDGEWTSAFSGTYANGLGQVTVGDIEEDGTNEIYVAAEDKIIVLRAQDGTYAEEFLPLGDAEADYLWVGDADNDGDREILFAASFDDALHVGDFDNGWHVTTIDGSRGGSSHGVAIGDADGDGLNEAYIARDDPAALWQVTHEGGWSAERVATFDGRMEAMFLGDTDADDRSELYVATAVGSHDFLHEADFGTTWETARLATVEANVQSMIVGDGDADGWADVYFNTASEGALYELRRTAEEDVPDESTATFNSRNGNEWWVQVHVSDADPTRVQGQDTGDPWKELELKDWGDWAGSFHVEPGNDVRYRAMVDGEWVVSCWFTHPEGKAPDGSETCSAGGSEEPPPSGDFDASFDTPGGNEWWVEVYVEADEPIAGVDARANGGKWIALEKKDWGAWAKSFHVEDGSIVEFRATSSDGDTDISDGYRWPSGETA